MYLKFTYIYYKYLTVLVIIMTFCSMHADGQIKVGDNPTSINADAILEIESQNKGLLLPRLSLIHSNNPSPLSSHVMGMAVYNTSISGDLIPGFYFNDGSKWVRIIENASVTNGIQFDNSGNIKLGGNLSEPTTINASATNTLAFTGLGAGNPDIHEVLMIDPVSGILFKAPTSSITKEAQLLHIAVDGQTQFNTPLTISNINKVNVYRNGVRLGATMININTIALEAGVTTVQGDEIRIVQFN